MGNLNTDKEEEIKGQENNYKNKMAIGKKKKKFFDVEIPIIKKTTHLYAYRLEQLNDRLIRYDLTRILRGKNALLQLRVHIKGDEATCVARELKILPTFLRKMVRKGTNYVESSFSTPCKNSQLRIKPFLITRKKVSRAVRKALREKAVQELIAYAKDKPSEEIFQEVLKNQVQKSLSLKLKKIYPLSLCEIRVLKVESEKPKKEEKEPDKKTQ